jgi:surfactin synthase thioesterase subunit
LTFLRYIEEFGDTILESLSHVTNLGKGHPIAFIGHSLGGLLIKQIIVQAAQKKTEFCNLLIDQTQGITFIATPQIPTGSRIKEIAPFFLRNSVSSIQEISDTFLIELHEKFLKNLPQHILIFIEKSKYQEFLFRHRVV